MTRVRTPFKTFAINPGAAVIEAMTPSPYSYDGHGEGLERQIRLQGELIARLVDVLSHSGTIKPGELEAILGAGYTVEP